MSYTDIDRHRGRVSAVISKAKVLDPGDSMRADLAKYVCVLLSGYVEQTVRRLVLMHCSNRSGSSSVHRYVEKSLKRFQSAQVDRIYTIVNSLDPALEAQVKAVFSASQEAAIDSVVNLRHQFAHGGQAATSIEQQEQYFAEIESAMMDLRTVLA